MDGLRMFSLFRIENDNDYMQEEGNLWNFLETVGLRCRQKMSQLPID